MISDFFKRMLWVFQDNVLSLRQTVFMIKKCLQKGYDFEHCEDIFNSKDKEVIKVKEEWLNNLAEGISNI